MAKVPVKKSSKKKSRRTDAEKPRELRIKITKPTIKDIELAIKKKLEAERTDLFRNCGTLLIIIKEEGGRPRGQ